MKARCLNPNCHAWENYGGRGIKVCEQWLAFENFLRDMESSYAPGLSIDRIDVDGNYCKENCRWADRREQAMNRRRSTKILTPSGLLNVSEASRIYGIKVNTILYRLYNNWPEDKLLIKADVTNRIG
jgi:hypothetical protein